MFDYERVPRPDEARPFRKSKYPIEDVLKTVGTEEALKLVLPDPEWATFYRIMGWHVRRRGYRLRTMTRNGAHYVWAEKKPEPAAGAPA